MVDMLTRSFEAVWRKPDQNPNLDSGHYVFHGPGVKVYFTGTDERYPLKFPDLISPGNLMYTFQHQYALPGFNFDFLAKTIKIGEGYLRPPSNSDHITIQSDTPGSNVTA